MRIVAATLREIAWTLDGRGAARGRSEREGIVLELRTAAGLVGRGEASPLPGMSRDTLADARRALASVADRAPFEIGDDTAAIFAFAEALGDAPAARFAVETALLELLARSRGSSLAALFDAADAEPLAVAIARMQAIAAADPAVTLEIERSIVTAVVVDDAAEARAATRAGTRCLKIKVGDRSIEEDVARVQAIAAAAAGAVLRLDANRRWPRALAVDHLARFAQLPIEFVEEPCLAAHELLAATSSVPIALDESLTTLTTDEIFAALGSPSLGALVLKPTLLGGFAPCIALASLARLANKPAIVTHTLESDVGFSACIELAHVIGGTAAHGLARPGRASSASSGSASSPTGSAAPVAADSSAGNSRAFQHTTTVVARPTLETVAFVWSALDSYRPFAMIHHALPAHEIERRRGMISAAKLGGDDAVVLFTSGSTADARGVVLSRAGLEAAADASAQHLGWRSDDAWFVPLSLAHAGGLAAVVRCWLARKPIALLDGDWDRVRAAKLLERCTLASLVPTQLADLLSDPAWRPHAQLRAVLLGGAAASPALLARASARGVPFLTTYGMTESFGQLATAPLARAGDPDAPLVPLPGVELTAGTRDEPAAIGVRAPMLATRYLDGESIAPTLVTRDLGFLDHGALVVVGRVDDVIVTGGENVHPTTVEVVLAATPGVRAAIAFAIPDERWGQIVGAAIATDRELDSGTLAAWHAALPAHARPRELAIVRELPVLATGKLDRRAAAQLPRISVRYEPPPGRSAGRD